MSKSKEKQEKKKKKNKKKKGTFSNILIIVLLLAGISVMAYPTFSDWWNQMHESKAITDYDNMVAEISQEEYDKLWAEAEVYNEQLKTLSFPFSDYGQLEDEYLSVLDITGNGIIGYITIPCIGVELPIYHGTSEYVLNKAVGHLEGSSLPIGGESTHAVLSAHRGLPTAKLFTDLDQVKVGDQFTITVLNKTLTYEVDQILIVEPTQFDALNVVSGEDYVTLMTCTPYGINTHRLFVRGKRVADVVSDVHIHADAYQVPIYVVIPVIGIPLLIIVLIMMIISVSGKSQYDVNDVDVSLRDVRLEEKDAAERLEKKKQKKIQKAEKKTK